MVDILKGLHGIALKLMQWFSLLFPWLAPFTILMSLVTAIETNYSTLLDAINGLTARVSAMPSTAFIGQANRVIPIGEMLGMLATLIGLKATCLSIRFVKSWIPTMN